ncbi:MAG: flagellar basal body-associated FliL family protein [Planctomycetaceae bacterium]|jgi:flagellar basal body-associated protein FliL|nr:flagellar basal body-associated FliL family protein [Planctomycetaceae bacterium]
MAKEQIKPIEPILAEQTGSEQPKSLLASRFVVILALVVLALAQMLLMYMLLPDPKKLANELSKEFPVLPETLQAAGLSPTPTVHVETRNWIEKKLGEQFKFQDKNRTDPTLYNQLVITITIRIHKKDESRFDRVVATRTEKLRDIVYSVLREAREEELASSDLLAIKQKIMMRINQELEEPFVKEVLCTDMSFSTS